MTTKDTMRIGAYGASYMFLGSASATVLSAIATILIARLLGAKDYGVYYLLILLCLLLSSLRDIGINVAATYYVSCTPQPISKKYATASIFFDLLMGTLIWGLLIILAPIIGNALRISEMFTLLAISSGLFIGMGLLYTSSGIIIGLEKANIASFLMLLCSIIRNALSIILIFVLPWPVFGALFGQSMGYFITGVLGSIYALKKTGVSFSKLPIKDLLFYGFPYAVYQLALQASFQIIGIIACPLFGRELFGAFSTSIYTFSAFVSIASLTGLGLLPAFARSASNGHGYLTTVKFLSVLFVPISALIVGLAGPIVLVVWGEEYAAAIPFFQILFSVFALTVFGLITSDSFLLGNKKPGIIALVWIPSIFSGIALSIFLYDYIGPLSFGWGIFLAYLIATFAELLIIRIKFHAWVDIHFSIRMLALFSILVISSNFSLQLLEKSSLNNIIDIISEHVSNAIQNVLGMMISRTIIEMGIKLILALIIVMLIFTILNILIIRREDLMVLRTATYYFPLGSIIRRYIDLIVSIRKKLRVDKEFH